MSAGFAPYRALQLDPRLPRSLPARAAAGKRLKALLADGVPQDEAITAAIEGRRENPTEERQEPRQSYRGLVVAVMAVAAFVAMTRQAPPPTQGGG